jgi:hypothetical protein
MAGFALANAAAALAPDYAALLGARLLLALSAATFMPAAGGYAAGLAGPQRHGRALAMVVGGLTLAIVAGVPLGVLVDDVLGWRATFATVGSIAVLSLVGIRVGLPRQPPAAIATLRKRLALARRADVLSVLAVTVLTVAGTFTVYTYLGVFLQAVGGASARAASRPLVSRSCCQRGGSLGRMASGHLGVCSRPAGVPRARPWRGVPTRGDGNPSASHPAVGLRQLGRDDGAAGAAGRSRARPRVRQPLAQLVGYLPRQRDRRGGGRLRRRPWCGTDAGRRCGRHWPGCAIDRDLRETGPNDACWRRSPKDEE